MRELSGWMSHHASRFLRPHEKERLIEGVLDRSSVSSSSRFFRPSSSSRFLRPQENERLIEAGVPERSFVGVLT